MVQLNAPEVLRYNNPSLIRIVVLFSPPSGKVTAAEEGKGFLDISQSLTAKSTCKVE